MVDKWMSMERRLNDNDGKKILYLERNVSKCHFVHVNWPVIETGPTRCKWNVRLDKTCYKSNNISRGSIVSTVTRLRAGRPRNNGSIIGKGNRLFCSPKSPDRLWGSASLVLNAYQGLFLRVQSDGGLKLSNHRYQAPKLRTSGGIPPLPTDLHGEHKNSLTSIFQVFKIESPYLDETSRNNSVTTYCLLPSRHNHVGWFSVVK